MRVLVVGGSGVFNELAWLVVTAIWTTFGLESSVGFGHCRGAHDGRDASLSDPLLSLTRTDFPLLRVIDVFEVCKECWLSSTVGVAQ